MELLTTFIKRPVLASMIVVCMVVLGIFSYKGLGVDSFPKVDPPVVIVFIGLDGAGPDEIETEITRPVEDAVSVIGGLDHITSTSSEGQSLVVIQFQLEKNIDVATSEVRDKVSGVINQFPDGTKPAVVQKYDPASLPILNLAVKGNRDAKELTQICKDVIKDKIESVDGVGQVNLLGARYREIRVNVYADKLAEFGIPVNAVSQAVSEQNNEVPSGKVTNQFEEYTLRTQGRLKSVEAFNNIVIRQNKGTPIKVKDVGFVIDDIKEPRTMSRLNGEPALSLQVIKTSDANTVQVIDNVKKKIKEIQTILPPDVKILVVQDTSIEIRESVDDIFVHLFLGGGLACLMVFLFMGNFRSTIIAAIAIPASIVSTFTVMKACNFTLNNITLLALALVVGIVIDDAIVVLENIWRLMEEKHMQPVEAAIEGTKEIGTAVIATTLSLIVLFIPIAFLPGLVGRYFQSYGITMAVAIFFSMVISFVLTPMLCSKLLKTPDEKKMHEIKDKDGNVIRTEAEPGFLTKIIQDSYVWVLDLSLKFWPVVLIITGLSIWFGFYLFNKVGMEFITQQDTSEYNISIKLPKGMPVDRSSELLRPLERKLEHMPFVEYVFMSIGTAQAGTTDDSGSDVSVCNIYVRLTEYNHKDPEEGNKSRKDLYYTQFEAMREARELMKKFKIFKSSVQYASGTGGSGSTDLSFSIIGDDLNILSNASDKVIKGLSKTPGYVDLDTDIDLAVPEVHVKVDRDKAGSMNVDVADVSNSLRTMVGGLKASNYPDGKYLYDVTVRLVKEDRGIPDAVKKLYVNTRDDKLVYLSSIADVTLGVGPSTIKHYNKLRSVTVSTNLEDYPQKKAMEDAKAFIEGMNLPKGYMVAYQGSAQYMMPTLIAFSIAFLLATIFMYMVLAAQFENLLDPLIILTTLPLSIPFALFSLYVAHMTLSIFSALGLFLLFGVVKKNAILQIDHTNNLRKQGIPSRDAILQANRERVRPILMTTLTLVVGMLPVALAGPTGAMKAPMAVVVVGGQSLCLLLSLLLVPVILMFVYRLEDAREKKHHKTEAEKIADEAFGNDTHSGEPAVEPELSGGAAALLPDESAASGMADNIIDGIKGIVDDKGISGNKGGGDE